MADASVLFLADICPWPADSGGAQRASHLIHQPGHEYRVTALGIAGDACYLR